MPDGYGVVVTVIREWWRRRNHPTYKARNLLDLMAISAPFDYRGVPTAMCPCGCDLILTPVVFNENREIAGYVNTGFCAACGAMVTVVTAEEQEVNDFGGMR